MQNKFYNDINVSTRIVLALILSLSMFIAKSIYLIIFLSILCYILILLSEKSVKHYLKLLKKLKFLLLFIFIAYIIIFRNITNSILFLYKLILVLFIIKQLSLTVNFENLNNGIKTLLKPIIKKNNDNISYDITLILYFISIYINSAKKLCNLNNNKLFKLNLKYYIMPRLFITMAEINKLENGLKLKCYIPKFENKNIKSIFLQLIFSLLFIVVIIKEVIM